MGSLTMSIAACPACKTSLDDDLRCDQCASSYGKAPDGTPVLLSSDHPLATKYSTWLGNDPLRSGVRRLLKRPPDRIWSAESLAALRTAVSAGTVLHLGAAFEPAISSQFDGSAVVRCGLPHAGTVDLIGDATSMPLSSSTVDSFVSSSVLEHVREPDDAVSEMFRVIRPGGYVYAEIPFMRGYHLTPEDYQRYTISGIERLFGRHGFDLVEKGVCSGPVTAWMLMIKDFVNQATPRGGPLGRLATFAATWLVHPFKHLDRFVNRSRWAQHQACNFYYLGRRPT